MDTKRDIFAGEDPIKLFKEWLLEAEVTEMNDPNAIALASVDGEGLPNVRIVLLKDISQDSFVFYTNYGSVKSQELQASKKASFAIHWKSLRRQIRVRGNVVLEDGSLADSYYASRSLKSRIGAWASRQSSPLESREELESKFKSYSVSLGNEPARPPFWGGYRLIPTEIEFWADGADRLHDRYRWSRANVESNWHVTRLQP
jgi:pyridoxamine 5'-phosphate oxidase